MQLGFLTDKRSAAVGFAAGVAVTIAGVAAVFSQDHNADECMVREMRGQPVAMGMTVRRMCERRFNVEVSVPASGFRIEQWTVPNAAGFARIQLDAGQNDTEVLTKGRFSFSQKPCDQSTPADFRARGDGFFKQGAALVFAGPVAHCAQIDALWGHHR